MAAAYAARKLGIPATIVVPSTTPTLTIERLKDEGATVKVVGEVSADLGRVHEGQLVAEEGPPVSHRCPPPLSHGLADVGRGLRTS